MGEPGALHRRDAVQLPAGQPRFGEFDELCGLQDVGVIEASGHAGPRRVLGRHEDAPFAPQLDLVRSSPGRLAEFAQVLSVRLAGGPKN